MRKVEQILGLLYLGIYSILPQVGHRARNRATPCCAFNRGPINPSYRVRIVDNNGSSFAFCCINCAEAWLKDARPTAALVYVTDEVTGDEIEATSAHFVRSLVPTNTTTGNHIHAFRDRIDAERHSFSPGAAFLGDYECPFSHLGERPCKSCCPSR